ncbi:MAG: type II secretion system minor pseudopilin GspK [Mariprofundaceae bacterium]
MRQAGRHVDQERGVALIIVLGLVALIGAWASTAAYEDMIALRRAENMQDAMRAVQASQSGFALAVMTLRHDARDSTTDDLDEAWAMETPPFPIDDGMVSGRIEDANRYLNLNDLVDSKGQVQLASVTMFKTLFRQLELDEGLVDALVDWVDSDDRPFGAGGAEDAAYYDAPYRVKNKPLDNWDELRMIKGFAEAKILSRLKEVAVVLPVAVNAITPVNINTAGAAVLLALFPKMNDADAESLIAGRPYADVASATNGQPWSLGSNPARLSVASSTFMVRTEARFGRADLREEYVVQRQAQKLSLISRQRLGWDAL